MPSLTTQNNERGFFASVMATEDNTQVTIDNYDTDVTFLNDGPLIEDDVITFTLNAGETYVVAGRNNTVPNLDGFIGARVTSTNPIAVNTGSILGSLNSNNEQDMGLDQLVPVELVDTEYICIRGNGNNGMERPMVVATQDNTEIFINGAAAPIATINAGEYYLVEGTNYQGTTHQNMYIEISSPSYLYQFVGGDNTNPTGGMSFIPPLSCNLSSSLNLIPDISRIGNTNFNGGVLVTTRTGATLTVNGVAVTEQPETVIGNVDWVTYKLNNLTGNTEVDSTEPITVGLFGASGLAGFYGFYSGFGVEINNEEVFTCAQEAPFNVLQRLPVVPDPSGIWTPSFASGTNIFDPSVDAEGIYTYSNPNECTDILIEVTLTFLEPIVLNGADDISLCDDAGLDGVAQFDFTANVDTVLGTQDRTQLSITLHNDVADLADGTNDIGTNYQNTQLQETIYIRVAPLENNNCFGLAEFNIEVVQLDVTAQITVPLDCGTLTTELQANTTYTGNGAFTYAWSTLDGSIVSGADTATLVIDRPGNYTLVVTEDETGCTSEDTVEVVDNFVPTVSGQPEELRQCDDDTDGDDTNGIVTFDLTQNDANVRNGQAQNLTISYHTSAAEALDNLNPIAQPQNFTNTVADQQEIFVRISDMNTSCFDTTSFNVFVDELPSLETTVLTICDFDTESQNASQDGVASFNLELAVPEIITNATGNETVQFYVDQNAIANNEPIANTTDFRNTVPFDQTIIAGVTNSNGCLRAIAISLEVNETNISENETVESFSCDIDPSNGLGLGLFDLDFISNRYFQNMSVTFYTTVEDAENRENPINTSTYTSPSTLVYAVVANMNQCVYIKEIGLTVYTPPSVLREEEFIACAGEGSLVIEAPSGNDIYLWFLLEPDGSETLVSEETNLSATITGTYRLVTGNDAIVNDQSVICSNEMEFTVIISETPRIQDIIVNEFSTNNSIEILVDGSGEYEYAIDNGQFQDSNIFTEVLPGIYTVQVRDILGCGSDEQEISVTSFPPFFTPNGDGINDTWRLDDFANLYTGSSVTIYDRYGKLLYQYIVGRPGWTGELNGRQLPSSDYWYVAKLIDGRFFRGHFTLKR